MRWAAIIFLFMVVLFTSVAMSETIINKKDADYIFSLTRPQWEAYAQRMVPPEGWEQRLSPHDTGTSVIAYDSKTDFSLSVQPLYDNKTSTPVMLIVGSYYPLGTFPSFTDERKSEIEAAAKKDLGQKYEVSAIYAEMPPLEVVELMVTVAPTPKNKGDSK